MDDQTAAGKHLFEPTGDFQCLHEFIPAARAKLSEHIWGYLVGATESETTLRRNRLAIDSLALRPRVCVDVSRIDTSTTLFGRKLRTRSVENMMTELRMVNPERVFFYDDIFIVDKKQAKSLFHAMIDEGIKPQWTAQIRADSIYKSKQTQVIV